MLKKAVSKVPVRLESFLQFDVMNDEMNDYIENLFS